MPFVLPDESVRVEVTPRGNDLLRGRLMQVLEPSPVRVEAPCPYFARCGGCQYQHAPYEFQADQKRTIVREVIRRVGKFDAPDEIGLITGEPWAYRNRTQFHIADGEIGFLEAGSHKLCPVTHCPISSPGINRALASLREMLRDRRFPRFVKVLEVFTNETETQLNVLETGQPVARSFFEWASETIPGTNSWSIEYPIGAAAFRVSYRSFFQVNRFLLDSLVAAALEGAGGSRALDLYAGVGLFSIPLARRIPRVTAIESGQAAVSDLEFNARRAGVGMEGIRGDVRTELVKITDRPDFVLADPPRAGIGKQVVAELLRLSPRVLSIVACDPASLARDLAMLRAGGYSIDKLTVIDLFPQTAHIETVARLRRE